jgi:hypothetical protein
MGLSTLTISMNIWIRLTSPRFYIFGFNHGEELLTVLLSLERYEMIECSQLLIEFMYLNSFATSSSVNFIPARSYLTLNGHATTE